MHPRWRAARWRRSWGRGWRSVRRAAAKVEIEAIKQAAEVEGREAARRRKAELDEELRARRTELQKRDEGLTQREREVEKRRRDADRRAGELDKKEKSIDGKIKQA